MVSMGYKAVSTMTPATPPAMQPSAIRSIFVNMSYKKNTNSKRQIEMRD